MSIKYNYILNNKFKNTFPIIDTNLMIRHLNNRCKNYIKFQEGSIIIYLKNMKKTFTIQILSLNTFKEIVIIINLKEKLLKIRFQLLFLL